MVRYILYSDISGNAVKTMTELNYGQLKQYASDFTLVDMGELVNIDDYRDNYPEIWSDWTGYAGCGVMFVIEDQNRHLCDLSEIAEWVWDEYGVIVYG